MCVPPWLANFEVTNTTEKWSAAALKPVIPSLVPPELGSRACVLSVKSPWESLLKASVRSGLSSINVETLKLIVKVNQVPLPPSGSGASKNLIRIDFAKALVHWLFPDLAPDHPEFQRMLQSLAGNSKKKVVDCPESVLEAVQALDRENAETFKDLQKYALQAKTDKDEIKAGRGSGPAQHACLLFISMYEQHLHE